ncbi:energy-coupling factor transporter ATPase [Anaerobutyricum soehngenii]|uniref:Energy-coupling factor transporter ATP-binding protein EcfA2 n=1 Tax=Anaerobutyricum soehngenii TaxID=105843 RepID=A0A6N7YDJ2_9FIRM|nr:energy-coupling factor transporter ATPase [Anaerobutyricum soehngenii]MSU83147.1 energy-coupling factor transporter ATPase [Anaerobutyricum soehngenii]
MNLIDVKNLLFNYKIYSGEKEEVIEHTAIDHVSLSIKKGDFVGILGHNGSGKSTLAKQLAALLKPSGGIIYVNGMDTAKDELLLPIRKTAGMVFQNPDNQLIGNIVEEDIAFGPENMGIPREEIEERITRALEATGMSAYREHSPNALSGGQKQKIAISGVLSMEPECIIFDEPTAMIDPEGRKEVLKAIYDLNRLKHITIIYITHFLDEVSKADYLYVMKQGAITLEGSPETLFKMPDQLTENNLELPFEISFIAELRKKGLNIPKEIYTKKQLLEFFKCRQQEESFLFTEKKVENQQKKCIAETEKEKGIVLKNISYQYKKRSAEEAKDALQDVSLSIKPGEFVAIVGKTGSGKSTLIQHLNGLLQPQSGQYFFEGQDIWSKKYDLKKLRQKVALCFQYPEYQLFEETILKDIAFGPKNLGFDKKKCEEKARYAMKLVGLPAELEKVSPFSLSGGQKRRVALAGILAMEPEYLILDEPVAGMDAPGKRMLFQLLHHLNKDKGITIVLVSHNMDDVAAHADRVLIMEDGTLKMDGTTREIFARKDDLTTTGLGISQTVEFYLELRKMQIQESIDSNRQTLQNENAIPLTIEELAECIIGGSE